MLGASVTLATVAGLSLFAGGCSAPQSGLPETSTSLEVALLQPAAGDTVAGEVTLRAALRGNDPIRGLAFLLDGVPLDTVRTPPWEKTWSSDAPSEGCRRTLSVQAWSADGTRAYSDPIAVRVLPDSAPVVSLAAPNSALWVERLPGIALQAQAVDPEEGPLDVSRILWTGDHLARPLRGHSLPVEILVETDQSLQVTATDRWGRSGMATISIRPFRYRLAATPEDCLQNLAAATQARDSDTWMRQAAAGFVFVPCPQEAAAAGWEEIWDHTVFSRRLAAWIRDPAVKELRWDWQPGPASIWIAGDEDLAWIIASQIRVRFLDSGAGKSAETELPDEEADLLLGRENDGIWRVKEWRDLPASGTLSLASVLAEHDGLAPAPAGRKCR